MILYGWQKKNRRNRHGRWGNEVHYRGRPGSGRSHWSRGSPSEKKPGADRVGEYCIGAGYDGDGIGINQQICGGISGKTLLRRMPVCRCCRVHRDRESEKTVWLWLCKRTAAFRRAGKHGGIYRNAETGWYCYGHEPGSRWTSDTRKPCQFLRFIFQHCAVWCRWQWRDWLRRGRAHCTGSKTEADHCRCKCLCKRDWFQTFPWNCRQSRRIPDGRYGSYRWSGSSRSSPEPDSVCRCCYDNHS